MTFLSRRALFFAGCILVATVAGCSQRSLPKVALEDVAALSADALLGALLGPSPERRSTMSTNVETPLLQKGGAETVHIATDVAAFVRESRGALTEKEIGFVQTETARMAGEYLKRGGFTLTTVPFPPVKPVDGAKTLVATFTPTTEEGGSPADKEAGRAKTFVLVRLTITDPATGAVLRIREFYSGRDAGVRP